MRLSFKYLSSHLNFDWKVDRVIYAGLEVDEIIECRADFSSVVVGRVQELAPHPNADRLQCCVVDVGDQQLNIVCGAKNVKINHYYPVALVGAVLPDNFKIKRSKIRGEASFGMLCSSKELGIDMGSEGIWDIGCITTAVGSSLASVIDFDDQIYDIDLTPNRGDCLSYLGMLREISALYEQPLLFNPFDEKTIRLSQDCDFLVDIMEPKLCPRYAGIHLEELNLRIPLPFDMAQILLTSGLRVTGNCAVDILNYAMLITGQPFHAFDAEKMDKEIAVRLSKSGEKITLIDGASVVLDDETLIIANKQGPMALAGLMGGMHTAVNADTKSIWLESAFFAPQSLSGKSRKYGIESNAAYRFERGVDFLLNEKALAFAAALLLEHCGGKVVGKKVLELEGHLPKRPQIDITSAQVKRVLGVEISMSQMHHIFECFGMAVESSNTVLKVVPPSYRFDIEDENHLVEEVARFIGYEQIMPQDFSIGLAHRKNVSAPFEGWLDCLKSYLVSHGCREVINYSFIDQRWHDLFFKNVEPAVLLNPISADQSVMRTSLLPGLLSTVSHNFNRQQYVLRLYEMGHCFNQESDGLIIESKKLAGVFVASKQKTPHWRTQKNMDFFDLKAYVENLFDCIDQSVSFKPSSKIPWMAEDFCADIIIEEGCVIGAMGLINASFLKQIGIAHTLYCLVFEFDLNKLSGKGVGHGLVGKFPTSRRDISFYVSDDVLFEDITRCLLNEEILYLKDIVLIDCYRGKGEKLKSLTIGLIFEADKTLKGSEIDVLVKKGLDCLKCCFSIKQRV